MEATGARYIWPMASGLEEAWFRVVVGGDNCNETPFSAHLIGGSDNEMFVNGLPVMSSPIRWQVQDELTSLKKGDVVAIRFQVNHEDYNGVHFALVDADGGILGTAKDRFCARVATKALEKQGTKWMLPTYDDSEWPAAVTSASNIYRHNNRPGSSSGVDYVTAINAEQGNSVYLRYRFGFSCGKQEPSRIFVTGDRSVGLYVNGKSDKSWWLRNPNEFFEAQVELKEGDVVHVLGDDLGEPTGFFGVAVAIKFGGRYISTGVDDWRAVKSTAKEAKKRKFGLSRYNHRACKWNPAQVQTGASKNAGKGFPFKDSGAKYVWRKGGIHGEAMIVRTVLGKSC